MKQFFTLTALVLSGLVQAQYTLTSWTTTDGLPSDDIRDVAVAPDGTIWLATAQGVAAFNGAAFTVHNTTTHPGLPSNDLYAIAVMSNGDVWVGSDFGASRLDDTDYETFTTDDGLSDNEVKNIKQAPNGEIWIATLNGATRFDGNTFTAFGSPDIPFGGTLHVAFADNGDVLFSGGLAGVVVYDGSTFTTIGTADGLVSGRVRSIAVDGGQQKWVGTAEGISVLDAANDHLTDHLNIFILPPPDELNPITDVAIDPVGRIWAGVYVDYLVTVGGVSFYANGVWDQIEPVDGLAGPNVRRLAVDADGNVWVATSTGLSRIGDINIGMRERSQRGFALYPNPASTTVELVCEDLTGAVGFEVCDAEGRLVQASRLNSMRATLDVSALEAGVYGVRIGDRVRPLVVQH